MTNKQRVGERLFKLLTTFFCFAALASSTNAAWARMPWAEIDGHKIHLEVASSAAQIQRGLMYRTSLPEDNGMVFIFHPSSPVKFWMAHCFISLDMLMIKDGKIIKIFENVPPCKAAQETDCPTYPSKDEPPIEVTEVVEVIGGYAKRHNIKEGDAVKFSVDVPHAAAAGAAEGQKNNK